MYCVQKPSRDYFYCIYLFCISIVIKFNHKSFTTGILAIFLLLHLAGHLKTLVTYTVKVNRKEVEGPVNYYRQKYYNIMSNYQQYGPLGEQYSHSKHLGAKLCK